MDDYTNLSLSYCKDVTNHYSTSFSMGIQALHRDMRPAIYAVYAMARIADEIVDTYYQIDQAAALVGYKEDVFKAINNQYSSNPVLQGFQWAANRYGIRMEWISAFFESMEMDLKTHTHSTHSYDKYIHGSAEVVGLMCMAIFCKGDQKLYSELEESAKRLGAAFQKVNFLRDLYSDFVVRGRTYFPEIDGQTLTAKEKKRIEADILEDFAVALVGIKHLPSDSRLGVTLAYEYYVSLFKKIQRVSPAKLLTKRIRLNNLRKLVILIKLVLVNKLSTRRIAQTTETAVP